MLPMRIIYIVLARASSRVRLPSKRPGFISWLQYERSGGIHIFDIFASVNTGEASSSSSSSNKARHRPAGSTTTIYILSKNTMYCIYLYIKRMRRIRLRCRGRTAVAVRPRSRSSSAFRPVRLSLAFTSTNVSFCSGKMGKNSHLTTKKNVRSADYAWYNKPAGPPKPNQPTTDNH